MFKKYLTPILLIIISLLSAALFLYKMNVSPPALDADEASFGYNAYSILKTGKDEYGAFLPLRLKSFGDYKMPLITYLDIPFIKMFGLTETGVRMVNFPFVLLFPLIIFLLAEELFRKRNISLLSAFLAAFAPGLQLLGRQAHEGFLTAFFLTLSFYLFLKFIKKQNIYNYSSFLFIFLLTLFGYQSSRLWAGFFLLAFIYFIVKKNIKWFYIFGFIVILFIFGITDIIYKPTRIQNLLFFNNIGFSLKITELRAEGGSRLLYNKVTMGAMDLGLEYLKYFSPQYFVITGDENIRFGYQGISPITPIEFLFIFIGFYFLFKNKEKWRYFILLMILIAPITACLSWAGVSVTRSIFIFIPILIVSSYGIVNFFNKKNLLIFFIFTICYSVLLFYSWDFYLNHYSKRAVVLRSWQAGYKEMVDYIKKNYNRYNRFYITKKNGQPYIFLLFYLQYPPERYQQIANLSKPDEYGFGQVESFDKYIFDLPNGRQPKDSVVIGYPDDFSAAEKTNLKEIKVQSEIIFYIKTKATTML